jgi:tetratricopeptide (TPR) repeat protein
MLLGLIIDEQRNQHQTLRPVLYQAFGKDPDSAYHLESAEQFISNKVFDYIIADPHTQDVQRFINLLLRLKKNGHIRPFTVLALTTSDSTSRLIAACADLAPDLMLVKPLKTGEFLTRITQSLERKALLRTPYMEFSRTGRVQETQKLLDRALRGAKNSQQQAQILRSMTEFNTEQNNLAQANASLQKLMKINQSPQTKLLEAELFLTKGQEAQAIKLLEETLQKNPLLIYGYDLLAEAKYKAGNGPEALAARAKANAINPMNSDRSTKLANEAYNLGDLDLAKATLEYQLNNLHDLDHDVSLAMLAQVYIDQNQTSECLEILEQAQKKFGTDLVSQSPNLTIALINAAKAHGNDALVSEYFARLIAIDEQSSGPKSYLYDAALCAYRLQNEEKGDHWLERVLTRQSLTYSQFQRIKETMHDLKLDSRLAQISLKAAKARAAHAERSAQFVSAGMYSEWAQDMVDIAEHADADIDTMLVALEALVTADEHGQLHQAANLVAESFKQRIMVLKPNAQQEIRLLRTLGRLERKQ